MVYAQARLLFCTRTGQSMHGSRSMLMGVELVDFVSDWSKCMNMYVRTGVCRLSATAILVLNMNKVYMTKGKLAGSQRAGNLFVWCLTSFRTL